MRSRHAERSRIHSGGVAVTATAARSKAAPSRPQGPYQVSLRFHVQVYAYGLWRGAPWAKPVGIAYALWATANLFLFPVFEPLPGGFGLPAYLLFAVPGIVGPWLAVWLLGRDAR